LTSMVNHGNNLVGSLERRDAPSRTAHAQRGGLHTGCLRCVCVLDRQKMANSRRNARGFWPAIFEAGKRPQMKGEFPFPRRRLGEVARERGHVVTRAANSRRRAVGSLWAVWPLGPGATRRRAGGNLRLSRSTFADVRLRPRGERSPGRPFVRGVDSAVVDDDVCVHGRGPAGCLDVFTSRTVRSSSATGLAPVAER